MSLKFEKVDSAEKFKQWEAFADSFGHKHNPTMPIVTVSDGDYMFAYYHILASPVIIPAFQPQATTPRNFKEMIDAVSGAYCLSSLGGQYPNGVCYAALDKESAVNEDIIKKLGFESTGKTLWRKVPK